MMGGPAQPDTFATGSGRLGRNRAVFRAIRGSRRRVACSMKRRRVALQESSAARLWSGRDLPRPAAGGDTTIVCREAIGLWWARLVERFHKPQKESTWVVEGISLNALLNGLN
jgi:hypothetical protein